MPAWINADYGGWFAEIDKQRDGLGMSQNAQRLLLRMANRKCVEWWHKKIIPKHFKKQSRHVYKYQKRKKPYQNIKRRLAAGEKIFVRGEELEVETIKKGGEVDIVRGGDTEQKATSLVVVIAYPRYAVANVRVPTHVAKKPRSGRPDMASELKSLTTDDNNQITKVWRKTFLAGARVLGTEAFRTRRLGKRSGKI